MIQTRLLYDLGKRVIRGLVGAGIGVTLRRKVDSFEISKLCNCEVSQLHNCEILQRSGIHEFRVAYTGVHRFAVQSDNENAVSLAGAEYFAPQSDNENPLSYAQMRIFVYAYAQTEHK